MLLGKKPLGGGGPERVVRRRAGLRRKNRISKLSLNFQMCGMDGFVIFHVTSTAQLNKTAPKRPQATLRCPMPQDSAKTPPRTAARHPRDSPRHRARRLQDGRRRPKTSIHPTAHLSLFPPQPTIPPRGALEGSQMSNNSLTEEAIPRGPGSGTSDVEG